MADEPAEKPLSFDVENYATSRSILLSVGYDTVEDRETLLALVYPENVPEDYPTTDGDPKILAPLAEIDRERGILTLRELDPKFNAGNREEFDSARQRLKSNLETLFRVIST